MSHMCLPFGALFHEIWYRDGGGGSHQRRRGPNYIKWVYFGQIIVKSTQFGQNWVLFFRKWYTDRWEFRQKIGTGIEKVRISMSGRHIHIMILVKVTPPPPGDFLSYNTLCEVKKSGYGLFVQYRMLF